MAEVFRKDIPALATEFQVLNKTGRTRTKRAGAMAKEIITAVFDTAVTDSSGASNKTIASHGLGVFVPSGAIITRAWYQVVTTFTSATDAATIALTSNSAGDIKAAVAISNGANPWDQGNLDGLQTGAASAMVKMTAERELTATVAVEALTAGKLNLFVEYVIAE